MPKPRWKRRNYKGVYAEKRKIKKVTFAGAFILVPITLLASHYTREAYFPRYVSRFGTKWCISVWGIGRSASHLMLHHVVSKETCSHEVFFPQSKHQRGGGGSNAAAKTRRELIHEPKMGNTTMPEFRLCTRNDFPTDFFTENEPRIRGRQPRRSFLLFRLFSFHFCRRDNKVRPTRKAFLLFCVCCWNAVRSLASHDWLVRSVKIEKETSFSFQDWRKRLFLSGWERVNVRFPGLQQCYFFLHMKWYQVTREC